MSTIQASFPENIFFSSQKNYKELSDFFFSVHINSDKLKTETPENLPIIQIKGIKKFFYTNAIKTHTQSISMRFCDTLDNFIADFRPIGEDNNWSTPPDYNASSDTLTFSCNENPLFTPNYTVGFELSTKCTFRKSLINNEPIILEVVFKNFDSIFDGLDNEINASYTIYAKEVPYVENVAVLNSEGKKVKTVLKGEYVTITWTVDNDNKTSVFLCDEIGNTVTTVPPYKVQINEDRRFTLKLEKDGRIVSLPVPVNQISPVEIAVLNENGNRWRYDGDRNDIAIITWSGDNIEKCTVSLCDEKGVVVATKSPYRLEDAHHRKIYTLKIERDNCIITESIPICYHSGWEIDSAFRAYTEDPTNFYPFSKWTKDYFIEYKKNNNIEDLIKKIFAKLLNQHFKYLNQKEILPTPDNKGTNLFFYGGYAYERASYPGFFIYIHPNIWFCSTLKEYLYYRYSWRPIKHYDNHPNWNDFKCYKTSQTFNRSAALRICYTFDDRITIRDFYYSNIPQWGDEITIEKNNFDKFADKHKDGEFLFCQGVNNEYNKIYAVYQHAVYLYELNYSTKSLDKNYYKFTLPEEAKGTNIISISNNKDIKDIHVLAILCDNNYVYLLGSDRDPHLKKYSLHLDYLKNPKDVLFYKSYVIIDGHVIFLDSNGHVKNIIESSFSPKQTIDVPENMFFGIDRDEYIKALTWDHKKRTFWQYRT